ncbi:MULTISPECIES: hypothetical protein [unclassified Streptomyces]|uniref:hypothetical protein n=1 Tax=unclassified Streptomyces TaxID=2593676 RepID=UPI002DDA30E2|nr:hypothetical protein [Streptomyces sp. NBC_01788]WSB27276.1 hypothetical protein OIE49_16045 [Streptomyces sp. NBC_01788]
MKRTLKVLACAAVVAAVAGTTTAAYAVPAKAPHATVAQAGTAQTQAASAAKARASTPLRPTAKKTAPTPRVVASGEHVTAAPGFELWLTAEGKYWTTPSMPDDPQFRSVVDGNIDRSTPGVSMQAEGTDSHVYLSGVYYGGKGTASSVEIATADGTVHGKLIELPGKPGWGAWYAVADVKPGGGSWDYVSRITVHDTKGKIYAQLKLR